MKSTRLNTRQWLLKKYLEEHFESGRFITIEEICFNVKFADGELCYNYNENPYNHDKCAVLSADVRSINWSVDEGWKIIIKDKKGNIKLCESREEFENWRAEQLKPMEKKWKYLNNLVYKSHQDGSAPMINLAGRVLDLDEIKVVEVYKKDTTQTADQSN